MKVEIFIKHNYVITKFKKDRLKKVNLTPVQNHGHGHLLGTGPGKTSSVPSIDVYGNVVNFWSCAAHWITY